LFFSTNKTKSDKKPPIVCFSGKNETVALVLLSHSNKDAFSEPRERSSGLDFGHSNK
jgi:hypothetical protein